MMVNCPIEWRKINDFAEILIMDSSDSNTFIVFPKLVSVVEDKKERRLESITFFDSSRHICVVVTDTRIYL